MPRRLFTKIENGCGEKLHSAVSLPKRRNDGSRILANSIHTIAAAVTRPTIKSPAAYGASKPARATTRVPAKPSRNKTDHTRIGAEMA
jgi:hypothetical protein